MPPVRDACSPAGNDRQVVAELYGVTPTQTNTREELVGLGWAVWLLAYGLQAKVDSIMRQLQPRHSLLRDVPKDDDEEAPTAALIEPPATPPYESNKLAKHGSKHDGLFWGGHHGPHRLIFLLRALLLVCSVTLAIIFAWVTGHDGGWRATLADPDDALVTVLALIPVFDVMLGAPKRLLPGIVIGSSIEQMKHPNHIKATLLEMKTEKTLRMLKLMSMLQAQATRARKLQGAAGRAAKPKRKPDPAQEAELREAFEFFDKDKCASPATHRNQPFHSRHRRLQLHNAPLLHLVYLPRSS